VHGIIEKPDVEIVLPLGYRNKRKWNKFSAVYQARGGETHLNLGHFNHPGVKRFRGLAHYYFGDVSVTLLLEKPSNRQELLSEIAKPTSTL